MRMLPPQLAMPMLAMPMLAAIAAVLAGPAGATTLGELQAQGYQIIRTSVVPGQFTGCVKNQSWSLADGSVFLCHEAWHVNAAFPRATLLQAASDQTYVLLIAGHAYDAALLRLGNRPLGTPLPLEAVLDQPPQPPAVEPPGDHIVALEPVDSINQMREQQDHLLLNQAQRYPLAAPDDDLDRRRSPNVGNANPRRP